MDAHLTVSLNAQTDKIRIVNPKNHNEHIPCRYVGLIEEEILPFMQDVMRPYVVEGINPCENFIAPMINGQPMKGPDSWELVGKIRLNTDRMFGRDSKYLALYHEFSGVPNEDFDPGFPRAYFLSTAIYYDMLSEQEPYMLLTEAFIDPQVKDLKDINPNQDLKGFLKEYAAEKNKHKHLNMDVHAQLISYKMGFPVGMNFDMDFKTQENGCTRKGWKKVLKHASQHMQKTSQKGFVNAFLALAGAIEIYDETLEIAKDLKRVVGTHLRSQSVPSSFILRRLAQQNAREIL